MLMVIVWELRSSGTRRAEAAAETSSCWLLSRVLRGEPKLLQKPQAASQIRDFAGNGAM
jgi:hypothetical protein